MKKTILLAIAAIVATFVHAGDSAPFLLDTAEGTRIATEGEAIPIAYSPRWGGAARCEVAVDGNRLLYNATDEGVVGWTPSGVGAHTLMYTAGDLAYTVQFTVLGDDTTAIESSRLQSNATWTTNRT